MKKYFLSALALPLLFACSSEDYLDQKATDNDQFAGIEKVDATFSLADMDEGPSMRMATQWGAEVNDRLGFAWLTDDNASKTTPAKITITGEAYQNHPLFLKYEDGVYKFVPETSIYVGKYFVYYPFDETTVDVGKVNFKSLENQPLTDGSNSAAFKAIAKNSINIGDKFTEVIPGGRTDGAGKVWDEPGIKASYKLYAAPFSNQTGLDLTYQKNNPTFTANQRIQGATDIDFTIAAGEEVGAAAIYSGTVQLVGASKSFTYAPTAEPNPAPAVHSATFWATQSNVAGMGFTFTPGVITLTAADQENGVTTKDKTKGWFWFNSLPVDNGLGTTATTVDVVLQTSYGTVTVPSTPVGTCAYVFDDFSNTTGVFDSEASNEWIKLSTVESGTTTPKTWNLDGGAHKTFINEYGDHKGKYALTVDFSTGDMSTLHIKNDAHLQTVLRYYIATGKSTSYVLNLDKDKDGEFKISKKSIALLQTINASTFMVGVKPCAIDGTHAPAKIVVTQDGSEDKKEVPALNNVFAVSTDVYLSSECDWTWAGGTDGKTALNITNKGGSCTVKSITNEGTLTVKATNVQLSEAKPLANAAGATMNITKVTTVKNALTNLGTINVGAADNTAAELRAYGIDITNDATSLTAQGVINNFGVVGVTAGTGGNFYNYGKIDMKNDNAITLLTSNETAGADFAAGWAAGNKMGTVVLPDNNPTAIVSVSNATNTGFIKYTLPAGTTTYRTPTGNVKFNTIVVSEDITFNATENEIQFIEFNGTRTQVVNPAAANLPNLKGVILNAGKSIIIEKGNDITCSVGAYLGTGATVYRGGIFTYVSTTNYFGNWSTDQIIEY